MAYSIKTSALVALLFGLFLSTARLFVGPRDTPLALLLTSVLVIVFCLGADRAVIAAYRARELPDPLKQRVTPLIDALSEIAGLPAPRILLTFHPQPNALAIAWLPERATIIVSSSLLDLLSDHELAGVIAHELAHIRSRDALLMKITTVLSGWIVAVVAVLLILGRALSRNGGIVLVPIGALAGLFAIIMGLAICRDREFAADADGAEICRHPEWLIGALQRIKAAHNCALPLSGAAAHLLFVGPQRGRPVLFQTHPPIQDRIARLNARRTAAHMRPTGGVAIAGRKAPSRRGRDANLVF